MKSLLALGLAGVASATLLPPAAAHPASHSAGSAASAPKVLDAQAPVPPLVYRSALGSYRPYADTTPSPWVESNERVGRIGGWRVYAKEAQQPDGPAADKPASAAHGGHKH
ncbi:hypothetical protein G8A07_15240 [Roseateles sp. DAIF2]|uniref:hypothetical protein n=1 Tax=Roseateles sp. DAIF2 TaxID=2714952 RepID=UPI0018A28F94|nr:hypothetical protein [Roseateles sp. DAIF2]QPF74134.1 hypothetical protein G8A07_15240 [Roseateles sp. DAIF2]